MPLQPPYQSPTRGVHTHRPSRPRRHHSFFAAEDSAFSEQSTTEDQCFFDDETTRNDRLNAWSWTDHQKSSYYSEPISEITSSFKKVAFNIPSRAAEKLGLGKDEVLILPPGLTHLKVRMQMQHEGQVIRVAVAGDMRFRDIVKQLLPAHYQGEVRACVKLMGEWQEPGPSAKVSDLAEQGRFGVNEGRDMEVKIEMGSALRKSRAMDLVVGMGMGMDIDAGTSGSRKRGMKMWERETGEDLFGVG
ncbi:hypothetical protein BKA66DRAFT_577269 [Pyrenochaeta sp. MPI-SDFR-AT-0127]|nr:hypothetical protein BKA66DRAFT_577269 [Pyrenochaeta sp. MPI-SDFR-AT-0127]